MKEHTKKGRMVYKFSIFLFTLFVIFFDIQNIAFIKIARTSIENLYTNMTTEVATARAGEANNRIGEYSQILNMYTDSDVVRTGNEQAVIEWLTERQDLRNQGFDDVFFIDSKGTAHNKDRDSFYCGDEPYFQQIMKQGIENLITNPVVSEKTGYGTFYILQAARDAQGKTFGIFAGELSVNILTQFISSMKLGTGGFAYILDGTGQLIAHPIKEYVMNINYLDSAANKPEIKILIEDMISGTTGSGIMPDAKGTEYAVFYAPIRSTPGWSMCLSIPDTQIDKIGDTLRAALLIISISMSVILLAFSILTMHAMIKPLKVVETTITDIAKGDADLTKRISINKNNEIGRLVDGFNSFAQKLHTIIKNVKDSKEELVTVESSLMRSIHDTSSAITQILSNINNVEQQMQNQSAGVEETASAVTEIAQNIVSLEHMIQNQAAGITQASAAVEQMIGNIGAVDSSVEKMVQEFGTLEQNAHSGVEKQTLVAETVQMIVGQSAMLQEANAAISNIAQQTNMLAMNAAIEAAHAGDAGKGFSVVADEIRKLSETSSEQSRTIGDELKKILTSIQSVVAASKDSEDTFNTVSEKIQQTNNIVQQIREAMSEQQQGSKQILDALRVMNNNSAEVRTASTEMAAGNKAILAEVKALQDSTVTINNSMHEMSDGAKEISKTSSHLTSLAGNVKKSVAKIGQEIDLFKV